MKKLCTILGLLLTIVMLNGFNSYTAHASTIGHTSQGKHVRTTKLELNIQFNSSKMYNVPTHTSVPFSNPDGQCALVQEQDAGWATTYNAVGTQLNLTNVSFGVANNCNGTIYNAWATIDGSGTCPGSSGIRLGGPSTTYFMNVGPYTSRQLFSGTLILRCVVSDNGLWIDSYVPLNSFWKFTIKANTTAGMTYNGLTIAA